MLETISKGFRSVKHRFQGKRELSEENIDEALREMRVSLLEADVDFKVVRHFIASVKEKAVGEVVQLKVGADEKHLQVTPGDHFIKLCQDELEALMGPADSSLDLDGNPASIMMIGLQGAGKTTTTGKLAKKLINDGKKPLLVAADIYRPAAVEQLKVLGERLDTPVFHLPETTPPEICAQALLEAKRNGNDVILFDTAGRLAIDEGLMAELKAIKQATQPKNVLLVVDAMIGQDAVRTAKQFDDEIGLTGFVMTKLDGDARGGAALSIKAVTQKPIKFLGMGEDLDALEEFRPDGLASRIMGFGDIVGLMKDFERVVDEEKAEQDAQKMLSGNFDMVDFLEQIKMIKQMGSLGDLFEKMPFFSGAMDSSQIDENALGKVEAMISSMTKSERKNPDLIRAESGRAERIARGSGHPKKEVLDLIERFKAMQKVMGAIGSPGGGNLLNKIPGFKQFSQMQKLRGMNMDDMMGAFGGGGAGGGLPGLPGMPGLGGMGGFGGLGGQSVQDVLPGLPKGYLPPGTPSGARKSDVRASKNKSANRKKNKKARAARKKQRRK